MITQHYFVISDHLNVKESTGGESDQTEGGDCILDSNSDLEAVVYMCTVCSEEFRSSALFLCHSCVDPKYVENNTTNSILHDRLQETGQNKLSQEMSVDSFITQHSIEPIEESPITEKNNMALADILREGNVECLVETMEDENNMCSDDTENNIDVVESIEVENSVDTLDEHEEDNFSVITHFRASSPKELTTLKSDCSNKPPKKVRKKKLQNNLLCSGCGDFFRNSYYLVTHDCQKQQNRMDLRKPLPHGSLGQSPFKCKCGKVIKHKSTFCRHIHHECKLREDWEVEHSLKLKQMKNIVFRCKNCDIVLKHKFTYLKHIKMCDLPKPYRCEPCNKEYKTVHTLKMHQQIVHKTCPVCKLSFKTKGELIEHKRGEH